MCVTHTHTQTLHSLRDILIMADNSETALWSNFLISSSKRSQNLEANCVIVGPNSSGKRQLARAFTSGTNSENHSATNGTNNNRDNSNSPIFYDYFDVDDKEMESSGRVNMWVFDEFLAAKMHEIYHHSKRANKVIRCDSMSCPPIKIFFFLI